LLARVVRPFHAVPVVISTLHNLTMERINGSSGQILEKMHRWTDHYADLTTVICAPALKSYIECGAVPAEKIAVFYNGVDTEKFRAQPDLRGRLRGELDVADCFVWLAIGRFEKAKDYANMICAFAKVVERSNEKLMLLICGRGSLEAEIRADVKARGLEPQVRFLGVRHDIADVMNAADGFVLSSYLEGLPMVLLQASSIGMPIVATNAGGNAEIVADGVNGFVVPVRDDEALAGGMLKVLRLPEAERAAVAERGRRIARDKFEIERILDQWEALYDDQRKKKSGQRIR
jgi:glycosyltransferase involved in cell wall biosynthesis